MPGLNEIRTELYQELVKYREIENATGVPPAENPYDQVRRKYIRVLSDYTGRNTIAYYSGWLQQPASDANAIINDQDKNSFMAAVHRMDRSLGLDLILHTPGGNVTATESIIDYLYEMFGTDIRVIVPQLAMSGGTMISMSAKEIIMGAHSSLGPIDPQYNGVPAQAILDEFEKAKEEVTASPEVAQMWIPIIQQYHPTLLVTCEQAVKWSKAIAENSLKRNMFSNMSDADADAMTRNIMEVFNNHQHSKSHDKHFSKRDCQEAGLNVSPLEDDGTLQDIVLSVHHAFMETFGGTSAHKIVENHLGVAFVVGH